MPTATKTNEIVFDTLWNDESGLAWLYSKGVCWTYDTYKSYPDVVRCQGLKLVKKGWNSDTGSISYREITCDDVIAKEDK